MLPLEVSLNGQNFTSARELAFRMYQTPIVSFVTPPVGPDAGGTRITVFAARLDLNVSYRCLFDGGSWSLSATHVASDGALACLSPAGVASDAAAPLLLGVGPLADPTLPVNFSFYVAPSLRSLDPSSGPVLGSTQLTINGSDFPPLGDVRCIMGEDWSSGTRLDAHSVRCDTPTLHSQGARASVTHDFAHLPEGSSLLGDARYGPPHASLHSSSSSSLT